MRWEFDEGQKDPWREQCVEYSSKTKKFYTFDVHAGFEGNNRSVGYGKQWSFVLSCVEERMVTY